MYGYFQKPLPGPHQCPPMLTQCYNKGLGGGRGGGKMLLDLLGIVMQVRPRELALVPGPAPFTVVGT